MSTSLDDIRADFALLDEWEDKYRYVIELGRTLAPITDAERSESNKVRGCASQVWLVTDRGKHADGADVLGFRGDSDAHIVRGLIAILLAIYGERPARELLAIDAHRVLAELGLDQALTPQRSNGLKSMVERVQAVARAAAA